MDLPPLPPLPDLDFIKKYSSKPKKTKKKECCLCKLFYKNKDTWIKLCNELSQGQKKGIWETDDGSWVSRGGWEHRQILEVKVYTYAGTMEGLKITHIGQHRDRPYSVYLYEEKEEEWEIDWELDDIFVGIEDEDKNEIIIEEGNILLIDGDNHKNCGTTFFNSIMGFYDEYKNRPEKIILEPLKPSEDGLFDFSLLPKM